MILPESNLAMLVHLAKQAHQLAVKWYTNKKILWINGEIELSFEDMLLLANKLCCVQVPSQLTS